MFLTGVPHKTCTSLVLILLIGSMVGCACSGNSSASGSGNSKTGDPTVCILATCVIRSELDKAIAKSNVNVPEQQRSAAVRRAVRLETILKDVQVLWVDDNPENNNVERNLLGSLGMHVDLVRTTELAISSLKTSSYNLVISDMKRSNDERAGLQLLLVMRKLDLPLPVIFYAAGYDPGRGVPPYAFGMTNRPDELLNLILDIIERLRSELQYPCCVRLHGHA